MFLKILLALQHANTLAYGYFIKIETFLPKGEGKVHKKTHKNIIRIHKGSRTWLNGKAIVVQAWGTRVLISSTHGKHDVVVSLWNSRTLAVSWKGKTEESLGDFV